MNSDKVSDVYAGRAGTAEQQRRTRERIHWMCRNVRGTDVLDVGCSQGIACILLGREGFQVVGIDHEFEAIEEARKELSLEDPAVSARVRFEYVEAAELPFADASLDSVLMGEVIEHVLHPERILAEVRRVLRPDGVLVISAPYGLHVHHDHKDAIYLRQLFGMLDAASLHIEKLDLLGPYVLAVAGNGEGGPVGSERLLEIAEQRLRDVDLELDTSRGRVSQLKEQREQLNERIAVSRQSLEKARARAAGLERMLARQRAHWWWRLGLKVRRVLRLGRSG